MARLKNENVFGNLFSKELKKKSFDIQIHLFMDHFLSNLKMLKQNTISIAYIISKDAICY